MARHRRKQAERHQEQPYDNVLKSLLEGQEQEMLPLLVPEVEYLGVLDVEVLRTPLRGDRVYRTRYRSQEHILHFELEAGPT